jgi:4-amino-4-deoxy-L-arabinose transferase-like glycosyltransferase
VLDYDIALHQPHPPGCFFYVYTAKLLHWMGLTPYAAMAVMSLLAGALTVALFSWWGGRMLDRGGAAIAAVLVLFSPLAWLYATRGDTYALSGFFSLLVGYLCWRLLTDPDAAVWPSALALGVAGGFRPTDLLFLAPLWVWSIRRRQRTELLAGLAVFVVVSVAWVVPTVAGAGGLASYRAVSRQLSGMVMDLSVLSSGMSSLRVFVAAFVGSVAALLASAWPLGILAGGGQLPRTMKDRQAWWFLAVWSIPAVLFYLLIHLGQAGYLMLLLPPAVLIVTAGMSRLRQSLSAAQVGVLLGLVVLLNYFFTWSALMMPDRQWEASYTGVAEVLAGFSGEETVAVTDIPRLGQAREDRLMLSYRMAMYLAPHIPVYNFPLEKSRRGGGSPNHGLHMTSFVATPPVTLHGIRDLVLMDPELRGRLPAGTPAMPLWRDELLEIYYVRLDPSSPLVLGHEGHLGLVPDATVGIAPE